jgi:sugar lactone lactonase YvrE
MKNFNLARPVATARTLGRGPRLTTLLLAALPLASLAQSPDYSAPYTFTTLAGQATAGYADGQGAAARFNDPLGLVVATNGIYVTESTSDIRLISPGGLVSTVAGVPGVSGDTNGPALAAQFGVPRGIAADTAGNLYVADTDNNEIRLVTPAGVVSTFAGVSGQSGTNDGPGSVALFNGPWELAFDGAGNLIVSDRYNNTLRKITPKGVVSTLAGAPGQAGDTDGGPGVALLNNPRGVVADTLGNIYFTQADDTVRELRADGTVITLAGVANQPGFADGTGSAAQFYYPYGIAIDGSGNLYVSDCYNYTIRKVTTNGVVTTFAGKAGVYGYADGPGSGALFSEIGGVSFDAAGNLYVADGDSHIRMITPAGDVSTFTGPLYGPGGADGAGPAASFCNPAAVALDPSANLIVADSYNNTIRKVTPGGVVTTVAGLANQPGSANGNGAAALFYYPAGVAVDAAGNIFVADGGNNLIRKIAADGTVTTVAGVAGVGGYSNGPASVALLNGPDGVAVDGAGNIYVSDYYNNTIRLVSASGNVTNFAGSPGVAGNLDGAGGAAQFNGPAGLGLDAATNLYVADSGNNTIRVISPAGVVKTLAGSALGASGFADGFGGAALFNNPVGVRVDRSGNVYVADYLNSEIRRISPDGRVTTLAGATGIAAAADGAGQAATFGGPADICVDGAGNVYVADSGNSTIRKGWASAPAISSQGLGLAGGAMSFQVSGAQGQLVVVQASADLRSWEPVWTNNVGAGPLVFSDPRPGTPPAQFYRVVTPNP